MKNKILIGALLVSLGLSGAAWAHAGATGIVKERMDSMMDIASQMKIIGKMLRAGPINENEMAKAAERIANHSGEALTKLFPEGSMQPQSEANPKIWTNWVQFQNYASEMEAASLSLKKISDEGADKKELMSAFQVLGATCKECHEAFRITK